MRTPPKPNRALDLNVRVSHLENVITELVSRLLRQSSQATTVTVNQGIAEATESGGGGGGGGGGPIHESLIVWDAEEGHVHDGVDLGTPIPLAGDVTGTNLATVVERIRGATVPVPGMGDDGLFVRYNDATGQFEFAAPTLGSGVCLLGAWTHADISSLTGTAAEIVNSFATVVSGSPMPAGGSLSAIVVKLTGDVGASGNDLTATVRLNGAPVLLTATVTGGAGAEDEASGTADPVIDFVAGDDISVEAEIAGTPAAVRATVTVWGFFSPEGIILVVVMGGDVSGNSDACTVIEIRGIPVPTPVAGDTLKVLMYVQGTTEYQLRHPHIKPRDVNSDITLGADDSAIDVDASVGNRVETLPAVSGTDGRVYIIAKVDATANTVTIDAAGAETINGAANYVLTVQYESVSIRSTGAEWRVF